MASTTPAAPAPRRRKRRYLDPNALLKYRTEANLSQSGLAARIGVGPYRVRKWEAGEEGASLETVNVLAEALGRKPEDLMPAETSATLAALRGHHRTRTPRQRIRYLDPNALLKYRIEANLNQPELAVKVAGLAAERGIRSSVTPSLVSHWEIGRHGTSLEMVNVLAEALGRKPEDLMPAELRARMAAVKPAEGGAAA